MARWMAMTPMTGPYRVFGEALVQRAAGCRRRASVFHAVRRAEAARVRWSIPPRRRNGRRGPFASG